MLDPMTWEADSLPDRGGARGEREGLFDGDLPVRPIHLILPAHGCLALITSLFSYHIAQRDVYFPSSHAVRTFFFSC